MQAEYKLEGVDITCDMLPVHALGTPSTPLPRWVYLRGCTAAGAAWDTKASGGGWRQESGSGKDEESWEARRKVWFEDRLDSISVSVSVDKGK